MPEIPPLVQGKNKLYCPEFCGVKWDGRGQRRRSKVGLRYRLHYIRRHADDGN